MKSFVLGLAAVLAVSGAANAATSPFVGSWKLDVAKSKFTGDTVSYEKTPTGFKFSDGSVVAYDFAIDGKDYPMIAGRTTAWTKAGDGGWDVQFKANGKLLTKAHRTLSPDGKQMATTYVEYRPDGTTSTEKDVYDRMSGTSGLAGKWKDVKVDATGDAITISMPSAGTFRLEDPIYKVVVAGKTDGSPVSLTGPTIPPGASATYKAIGPGKWDYSRYLKGKLFGMGEMVVSPDGKELTDTSWSPGKESEKSVSVFAKN